MPEQVSTDNINVAIVLAATELIKKMGVKVEPELVGRDFKIIYQAISEATAGR